MIKNFKTVNMISPQDMGRLFEKYIHFYLEKTNLDVLSEKEVKAKYGKHISAIDHLIELDSYIICIQDKYTKDSISISAVNHFIKCVSNIQKITHKNCYGIYLSKKQLSSYSQEAFSEENRNSSNYFTCIYNYHDYSEKKSFFDLTYQLIFHMYEKHGIYFYDSEDACLMYDSDNIKDTIRTSIDNFFMES